MNYDKWINTLHDLELLVKYKKFDEADERARKLHRSFFNDVHDLTQEESYAVLLELANCLVNLGSMQPNENLLNQGKDILTRYQDEFVTCSSKITRRDDDNIRSLKIHGIKDRTKLFITIVAILYALAIILL